MIEHNLILWIMLFYVLQCSSQIRYCSTAAHCITVTGELCRMRDIPALLMHWKTTTEVNEKIPFLTVAVQRKCTDTFKRKLLPPQLFICPEEGLFKKTWMNVSSLNLNCLDWRFIKNMDNDSWNERTTSHFDYSWLRRLYFDRFISGLAG